VVKDTAGRRESASFLRRSGVVSVDPHLHRSCWRTRCTGRKSFRMRRIGPGQHGCAGGDTLLGQAMMDVGWRQ